MAPENYPEGGNQPGEAPYRQPGDRPDAAGGYQQPPGQHYPSPGAPANPPGNQPYPGDQPYPGGQPYPAQEAGPPPGAQPYNAGDPYAPAVAPRRGSGMAVAALVLGILGLITSITVVGGIILGLLAVILGVIASKRAKRGEAGGRGMALAGIVTGVLGIIIAIALVAAGASLLNSKAGKNLQSCLSNASGDQAQIQSCQNQYRSQVSP
ncbi:MAG: DUF4190 domain-containing protein [Actinomycetota bacterium]|nr:DUF4190 domain-containing protein [Actinomycetota bacterium]